jgi:hypothetical protein
MSKRLQSLVVLAVVTLPACREKEVTTEAVAEPEVSDAHARVTEFEGEWIFVGQAHPWRQGDQYGYAGFAQIRGTEIRFHFVRSPSSAPETMGGLCPIPEVDRMGVSVDYVGKLVDAKGEGMPGTEYLIQGTCFDQMPLWPVGTIPGSILIGGFDPPFMFKSVKAHPIIEAEEIIDEISKDPREGESSPDGPFSSD